MVYTQGSLANERRDGKAYQNEKKSRTSFSEVWLEMPLT